MASTPETVRVHYDTGGCRIGGARANNLTLGIVAMVLAAVVYRRPRRRR